MSYTLLLSRNSEENMTKKHKDITSDFMRKEKWLHLIFLRPPGNLTPLFVLVIQNNFNEPS